MPQLLLGYDDSVSCLLICSSHRDRITNSWMEDIQESKNIDKENEQNRCEFFSLSSWKSSLKYSSCLFTPQWMVTLFEQTLRSKMEIPLSMYIFNC